MERRQTSNTTFSKYNVLAQQTYPMNIDNRDLNRLAGLSNSQQWILFTAECPRPNYAQFETHNISCKKIIQMRSSQRQSELEIVIKAIKSGNASAIIASDQIAAVDQDFLQELAFEYHCEVFFVESRRSQYH